MGFASLPFERTAPAVVVVPEVTYGSEADGREWVTVVAAHRAKLPRVGGRGALPTDRRPGR